MSFHARKLLLLGGLILATIALGLEVGLALFDGWRALRPAPVIAALAMMLLFGVLWRRLNLQEAEAGGDGRVRASPAARRRKLIVLLAAAALSLAAGLVLYATRG